MDAVQSVPCKSTQDKKPKQNNLSCRIEVRGCRLIAAISQRSPCLLRDTRLKQELEDEV